MTTQFMTEIGNFAMQVSPTAIVAIVVAAAAVAAAKLLKK